MRIKGFVLAVFACLSPFIVFSQSGCIDNNHGGDYIYGTIISGTDYDYYGDRVPHTYNPTTSCNAVILPSSPYSSCTIKKDGIIYGTGSLVNYSLENCPLDDYTFLLLILFTIIGYFLVNKKHLELFGFRNCASIV